MTLDIKALAKQAIKNVGKPYYPDANSKISLFQADELAEFVRLVREPLETHNTMLKAALRGVIKVADRKTDEFDAAHEALKGETK